MNLKEATIIAEVFDEEMQWSGPGRAARVALARRLGRSFREQGYDAYWWAEHFDVSEELEEEIVRHGSND